MMSENKPFNFPFAGTLALVGSGEYLEPIEPLDRWLMSRLNEPARVVCLPTAAGTEGDERIQYWSNLGVEHFTRLGAAQARAPRVIDRASAEDARLAAEVRDANFIYLSGGKPAYLYGSLLGTAVWGAILEVLAKGGVVAGCSAGAMIFGERIPTSLFSSNWQKAFGLLQNLFIIPHFDEIPMVMLQGMRLLAGKLTIVGVEGSTALVCSPAGFEVRGLGQVKVIRAGHEKAFGEGNDSLRDYLGYENSPMA
jgi:cyanophycinase